MMKTAKKVSAYVCLYRGNKDIFFNQLWYFIYDLIIQTLKKTLKIGECPQLVVYFPLKTWTISLQ